MWTEVSSSVPHFLHMGSLHNPMICKCLLKVLCPVSRSITTLVCVLLKDSSRAPIARSGPEINSWACLCVLQGPRHNARGLFCIQRYIFLLMFCLETPKTGSGTTKRWEEPPLASLKEDHKKKDKTLDGHPAFGNVALSLQYTKAGWRFHLWT